MARPEKTETREIGLPKSWWAKLEADARKAERAGADAQIRFLVKSSWDAPKEIPAVPHVETSKGHQANGKRPVLTPSRRQHQSAPSEKPMVMVEHGGPRGAHDRPLIFQNRGAGLEPILPKVRR